MSPSRSTILGVVPEETRAWNPEPATVAASTPAAPTSDASTTFPLRNRYMYQPTNSAIGIVQAMVNVPHELPGTSRRAFLGRRNESGPASLLSVDPGGMASRNDS